eukprot:TRINITY_DN1021_c0_g2_i1.p1 TRINITY_DN1021_c0_g2~~TRINITY_DN1021_c0_g2_i1.p1  ORF type:complete len:191 (-),score=32.69 TRINITY_DN1021_c0_g2_i1:11-499(-)
MRRDFPLFVAIVEGDDATALRLLENAALVNENYSMLYPLHVACLHGRVRVVRKLLERGANHTLLSWDGLYDTAELQCNQSAAVYALLGGDPEILQLIEDAQNGRLAPLPAPAPAEQPAAAATTTTAAPAHVEPSAASPAPSPGVTRIFKSLMSRSQSPPTVK